MQRNRNFKAVAAAMIAVAMAGCGEKAPTADNSLPRAATPEAMAVAADSLWAKAEAQGIELHSVMVVQHDSVIYEHWANGAHPDSLHVLYSVTKTFTSLGVGLAVADSVLSLDERVVDIFPDCLPDSVSDNLAAMKLRHLLTMSCGHAAEPSLDDLRRRSAEDSTVSWAKTFLSHPVDYEPGTVFCYNSVGSHMLSEAVQRRTGKTMSQYLTERLFTPLGIDSFAWDMTNEGVNTGGWGLMLRTEDLAKAGQLLLDRGRWRDSQIVPADWVDSMTTRRIQSVQGSPNSLQAVPTAEDLLNSDWVQGYGFQVWRCRHDAFRADGSFGQFIVVMPELDAVAVLTANSHQYQNELNLVWDYILPVLESRR